VPLSTCQHPSYGRVSGTGQKEQRRRIGYARVSTPEQSCALQCDALEQSGCTKVFQEVASGAKAARPALTATLEYLRAGDTLVVWRLDRLGRSLGQLMALMQVLQSRQVGFQSLVEAIDTTTATGQFFFGSLVISGVCNYLLFQANKAYPDKSRWIRWNKCVTFRIP
jgi:hypothetical protein